MLTNNQVELFQLAIPERDIQDLKDRLNRTRWPNKEPVSDWSQGVPLANIQALCEYWRSSYDWRRCERMLNGFGQYRTTIDGLGIHFLHIRSPEPNALPLLMTHGWPGSVVEFHKVIGPLTNPVAYGGQARDAFHLVLPSLPGHGFSDQPAEVGWNIDRVTNAWIELMQRLGYGKRWAAQGGDWGELVVMTLGNKAPQGLIGLHASTLDITPTAEETANASPKERTYLAQAQRYRDDLSGYATQQTTRPQTLGYALADSPAGQAAWIYEKFHDWTDNQGTPESVLTRDELLDNIMLYWLPDAGASSARFYWENAEVVWGNLPVAVPLAISLFPKDQTGSSRRWAERRFSNLVYWNELERGGHFGAFEQPVLFTREIRAGFRQIRA
ncbi:epoxide hydrolase (plasmid) [Hymenobacter psoromatis]|nr:epoxide hydrolase [Hymenobacter psoromatis]